MLFYRIGTVSSKVIYFLFVLDLCGAIFWAVTSPSRRFQNGICNNVAEIEFSLWLQKSNVPMVMVDVKMNVLIYLFLSSFIIKLGLSSTLTYVSRNVCPPNLDSPSSSPLKKSIDWNPRPPFLCVKPDIPAPSVPRASIVMGKTGTKQIFESL